PTPRQVRAGHYRCCSRRRRWGVPYVCLWATRIVPTVDKGGTGNSGSGMPKPTGVVGHSGLLSESLVREVSYHFVIPRIDSVVQVGHSLWSVLCASARRSRVVIYTLVGQETMNYPCPSLSRSGVSRGTRPPPLVRRPSGRVWPRSDPRKVSTPGW